MVRRVKGRARRCRLCHAASESFAEWSCVQAERHDEERSLFFFYSSSLLFSFFLALVRGFLLAMDGSRILSTSRYHGRLEERFCFHDHGSYKVNRMGNQSRNLALPQHHGPASTCFSKAHHVHCVLDASASLVHFQYGKVLYSRRAWPHRLRGPRGTAQS